jgi:hypothetical protein
LERELRTGTSDVVFRERLLHRMDNLFDEFCSRFIGVQGNPVLYCLFEVREKTRVEALKYLIRVQWEGDHLSLMICQQRSVPD